MTLRCERFEHGQRASPERDLMRRKHRGGGVKLYPRTQHRAAVHGDDEAQNLTPLR